MMDLLWLAPVASVAALAFAWYLAGTILRKDEGTDRMREITGWVREGAQAYLRRQYRGVALFFVVMFGVLLLMATRGYLTIFVPFAFLTGGVFSGLAGFIGMSIATRSSARTAHAASRSLNEGLRIAFSSGAVMGLVVVGLGLLHLSIWTYFLNSYYSGLETAERFRNLTSILLTSGMGASSMALFARVGGGIFTKAADVGADLVGKVEAGIPEDDPRNPAVIADNVGDNVGDVAGMGADLYESYIGSIVATAALALAGGFGVAGVTLPFAVAAIGVFAAIGGTFFVQAKEQADQKVLLGALRRGVYVASFAVAIGSYFLVIATLGAERIGVYWAILSGLLAGNIIGFATEYYTSGSYKPTQQLAATSQSGPATVIIGGLALGMMSTAIPVVVFSIAIMASFYLAGGAVDLEAGLDGIGVAAVGMLSTLGITLATDAYGPVADNAGGVAEMAGLDPHVRERTDALDSLGNTTAATGKGFAIGSAALTAMALIASYRDQVAMIMAERGMTYTLNLSVLNPKVIVGTFIGGMLPFLFSAFTMQAVGRAAQEIVQEVRRQFREIKGLMEGTARADYAACVDICTRSAQREMITPSLMAIVVPVLVGVLLGVEAVIGLLIGATVGGFVMAVMMANAGGAWDNAKKYIEAGSFGGKGSPAHKAAVVGDTVGDPFKDTSGPSLNILIKLVSMVSVVFASFVIGNTLIR